MFINQKSGLGIYIPAQIYCQCVGLGLKFVFILDVRLE